MADLIIKASSNNDLVIQGSDDSPAITIGDTGTTTFAENATMSGTANNLGTVTAGVLNSGVTGGSGLNASFKLVKPTGATGSNLIQIKTHTSTTELNRESYTFDAAYSVSTSITPKYSDSKLYVLVSGNCNLHGGSNSNTIAVVGLFEGTVSTIRADTRVGANRTSSNQDSYFHVHLQYMADAGTAGVAQTFGIAWRQYASAYDNGVRFGQDYFPTVVTIMEFGG